MAEEQEFRKRVEEIGRLLTGLDQITDSHARNSARDLVQLVMDLHSAGIEKIMEVIFEHGAAGEQIIGKLGCDRMTGILLALHGLHPDLLEKRVERAITQVAARLHKQAVDVQLLSVTTGVLRVRATMNNHACGSTAATVRAAIEEAVYEIAPEVSSLVIDGLESGSANGFVGLDQLISAPAAARVEREPGN